MLQVLAYAFSGQRDYPKAMDVVSKAMALANTDNAKKSLQDMMDKLKGGKDINNSIPSNGHRLVLCIVRSDMNKSGLDMIRINFVIILFISLQGIGQNQPVSLAQLYKDYFRIGVAVSPRALHTDEADLIKTV